MITSATNPRLKQVRALLDYGKRRRAERYFVLEGERLIGEAVAAGVKPRFVLYRPDTQATDLLQCLEISEVPCLPVEGRLFDELSDTQTPQGILTVCSWPDLPVPQMPALTLILDGVADPGNLGTILRTAVAVGVDLVVLAPHTVDPFSPKVVRSAMGAHFHVPLRAWNWQQIGALNVPFFVTDMRSDQTIYETTWKLPLALIIGGETSGLSSEATAVATHSVRIPMVTGESLNAAIATAVVLYEIFRQTHLTPYN